MMNCKVLLAAGDDLNNNKGDLMRKEFQVHILNEQGIAKATELGEIFSEALSKIEAIVPPGRDLSLVVTRLQEASFFAKRGIAVDAGNQR